MTLTCGPALSARPREGRWAAGALALAAAVLGRGVGPRRKGKRPVRACASCVSWAAGERIRPTGPEARQRESFPFLFIFQAFESFIR